MVMFCEEELKMPTWKQNKHHADWQFAKKLLILISIERTKITSNQTEQPTQTHLN